MKLPPKLSELVEYLNGMQQLDVRSTHHAMRHDLDKIIHHIVYHPHVRFKKRSGFIFDESANIERAFENFIAVIDELKLHVINLIREQEPQYLQKSLDWFENEMPYETNDYVLNRVLEIDDYDKELLMGRIYQCEDWALPGMIFGPGRQDWIQSLVSLDPLYLLDRNLELLDPAKERFHPVYQRRLRTYAVKEKLGQPILNDIPDCQFGFVFAYNYFNFRPFELICQYLKELFEKLRPGGVILMTFNDCDYSHGVALSENYWGCYTPGTKLVTVAEKIGYIVSNRHRGNKDVFWIELTKPGLLRSLRGGQTLAKIVAPSK